MLDDRMGHINQNYGGAYGVISISTVLVLLEGG